MVRRSQARYDPGADPPPRPAPLLGVPARRAARRLAGGADPGGLRPAGCLAAGGGRADRASRGPGHSAGADPGGAGCRSDQPGQGPDHPRGHRRPGRQARRRGQDPDRGSARGQDSRAGRRADRPRGREGGSGGERETAGTSAAGGCAGAVLAGACRDGGAGRFGLPPDEALAANQHIQDMALEYKAAGVPGTMDQLRVRAFLDAINGTSPARPPATQTPQAKWPPARTARQRGPWRHGRDRRRDRLGRQRRRASQERRLRGRGGAGGHTMLTIPLVTLLGLADNPGEARGLGAIDPAMARQMAASAARNPRSTWCVTVTDELGHAIGHGCARPARGRRKPGHDGAAGNRGSTPDPPPATDRGSPSPKHRTRPGRRIRDLAPDHRRTGLHRHADPDPGHRM